VPGTGTDCWLKGIGLGQSTIFSLFRDITEEERIIGDAKAQIVRHRGKPNVRIKVNLANTVSPPCENLHP
jgi:hypothetical protein